MAKKNSGKGWKIALITGIIMIIFSYLMYIFFNVGFFSEVYQEIFGIGATLALIGIIWALFKINLT